jgi:hypothetical protein
MTTGNATDFGDLTSSREGSRGLSSSTRGVIIGGSSTTVIEFITIASQGNSIDYGDVSTSGEAYGNGGYSNSVRGVCVLGASPSATNAIEFFNINAGGTAQDFGDLTVGREQCSGASEANGGLNDGYQGTRPPPIGGGSGFIVGGEDASGNNLTRIERLNINTLGNSSNFGDMVVGARDMACVSSYTRQLRGGGRAPGISNIIESFEMQSTGNAADFGDLTAARRNPGGFSSSTRGLFAGGNTPSYSNVIDYVTIAAAGNATDFGDLTVARRASNTGAGSSTRTIFFSGYTPAVSPGYTDNMDYVTTASTGNAIDFGDGTIVRGYGATLSNSTRAVHGGGQNGGHKDVIDYVTIASTGNATDFGDLTTARSNPARLSNTTRGVFATGYASPTMVNVIDYITIASTGNAIDFGDVTTATSTDGQSDSHGGLQG